MVFHQDKNGLHFLISLPKLVYHACLPLLHVILLPSDSYEDICIRNQYTENLTTIVDLGQLHQACIQYKNDNFLLPPARYNRNSNFHYIRFYNSFFNKRFM